MPFGLLVEILGKIIDGLTKAGQMKADEADKLRQSLADAQVQADKTFADFMKYTTPDPASLIGSYANALNVILRAAIVAMFAAALVSPSWGAALAMNARSMPIQFWLIIGWEFYGNAMLKSLPWFKNGNGGSNTPVPISTPSNDSGVITPAPKEGGEVVTLPDSPISVHDK